MSAEFVSIAMLLLLPALAEAATGGDPEAGNWSSCTEWANRE